jgi:hypothetical protein
MFHQKTMTSIEESIKQQFARLFGAGDWTLFKKVAEYYFQRAAFLKKADINAENDLKLLIRNSQKRLCIGIGVEFLLKAVYLKYGFAINKPDTAACAAPKFPFSFDKVMSLKCKLLGDKTYMLNDLIEHIDKIQGLQSLKSVSRGLKIAKVFRNKEGHMVAPTHKFDAENYRDIEKAVVLLYAEAFEEKLDLRFAFADGEKGIWKVSSPNKVVERGTAKRRL